MKNSFQEERKDNKIDFVALDAQAFRLIKPFYAKDDIDFVEIADIVLKLIEIERNIIDKRGKFKSTAERNLLTQLIRLYHDVVNEYIDCDRFKNKKSKSEEQKVANAVFSEMLYLVNLVFDFNIPKDNFFSQRKSYAYNLYLYTTLVKNIKDEFEILRKVLSSNKDALIRNFMGELSDFTELYEVDLPEDIVESMYRVIKKTKSRPVAVTCLQVLINVGHETEMTALGEIDDWKDRNGPY